MNSNPFYKRTEFYLTFIAIVFGVLLGGGFFGQHDTVTQLLGMAVQSLAVLGYTAGRTIAKCKIVGDRPGYKTSEFWQTASTQTLLAVQAFNILPTTNQLTSVLTAVLATLPTVGYVVARGKIKASQLGCLAIIFSISLGGCASAGIKNQSLTALQDAHAALKATSAIGEKVFEVACGEMAKKCQSERRAAENSGNKEAVKVALSCEPLAKCHSKLQAFNKLLISGQLIIVDGLTVLQLDQPGGEDKFKELLERLRALIGDAQLNLASIGG